MLTLTAKQLFQSVPAMAALVAQKIKSPKLAYNLGKSWKDFQEEYSNLQKTEREIYEDFNATETQAENGAAILTVDVDNLSESQRAEFESRRAALMLVSVELWGHPLTLEDLEVNGIELSPAEFAMLDWLIVEKVHETHDQAQAKGA